MSFRGKSIPHFADGILWVKRLDGIPGDEIKAVPLFGKQTETVMVNGMPRVINIRGFVYLYPVGSDRPHSYRALETDTMNRQLPMISSQVIKPHNYFVTADAQRSFDSRYWGLLDERQIVGKAYPIF